MKENVSNKLKLFNYVLTLIIVLYHSRFPININVVPKSGIDTKIYNHFIPTCDYLCYIAMTGFFLISAFLFYFNLDNNGVYNKLKKRFKTLFIPYIIWICIVLIFQIIILRVNPFKIMSILDIFVFGPIDGPLWYIEALMILMLFSPIIIKLKDKKKLNTIVYIISILYLELRRLMIIPMIYDSDKWWWYRNMIFYLPAYLTGIYLAFNYKDIILNQKYNKKYSTIIGTLLFVISLLLINVPNKTYHFNDICFILIFISLWLIFNNNFKKYKIYDTAFFMYVTHQPILILIIDKIIRVVLNNHIVFGYQIVLIKLIQAIIIALVSYLITYIFRKLVPSKINSYIFGGRI